MPQRFTSIEDAFRLLEKQFNPQAAQAQGTDVIVQLHLTGEGGGDWFIRIRDGQLKVVPGVAAETPDLTVTVNTADYLALLNGEMDPLKAYLRGKVKVQGEVKLVYRLQYLFRLPEA